MADPRTTDLMQRRANLSPLMQAKAKAADGQLVNACPFGCTLEDLDANGYCDHVVGFSNDGKTMEPFVTHKDGRRLVRVKREKVGGKEGAPILEPVLKDDVLVQITVSSRVYRNKQAAAPAA